MTSAKNLICKQYTIYPLNLGGITYIFDLW